MIDEDPVISSDEAREAAARILARPEFRDDRNVLERAVDAVFSWLADLFSGLGGDGGSASTVIVWVLLVGAAIAVLVASSRSVRGRRGGPKRGRSGATVVLGEVVDPEALEREAARALSRGELRDLVVARYRLLVVKLIERGELSDVVGRTTGEYRDEFTRSRSARSLTGAVDDFGWATDIFELVFYGDGTVERREVDELDRRCESILSSGRVPA